MDRHKLAALFFVSAIACFGQSASRGADSVTTIKNASYCPDTSITASVITCSTAVGFVGYMAGHSIDVLLANTVTGATTINVLGLGAKAVTFNGTNALTSGLLVVGGIYRLTYDGTRFILQGSVPSAGSGTVTVVGGGNLTSTDCVTGGGSQTLQTPSANCTVDAAGNIKANSISVGATPPAITPGTGGGIVSGEGTDPSVGFPAAAVDGCIADSTAHGYVCSFNNDALKPMTRTIASGTSALGTGAITANTCAAVVTTAATGTVSTDTITWSPNVDISGVTGYGVATTDGLKVYPYPTTNNVNWRVCNGTALSITPGAVTLNWTVVR